MSVYDDADNATNVVTHGECWYPFEPVSALISVAPIFRENGVNFLGCDSCDGCLDPWDVAHDDFGNLRCAWCGSDKLDVIL